MNSSVVELSAVHMLTHKKSKSTGVVFLLGDVVVNSASICAPGALGPCPIDS